MGRLHKKQFRHTAGSSNERLAVIISKAIVKLQTSFATVLSKTAAKFPTNTIKWLVVLFTLGWIILSSYYISLSFIDIKHQNSIYISHLRRPLTQNYSNEKRLATILITKEEYKELVQFHFYIDSLAKYANSIYDSILSARPGLMDSVLMLEQIYTQQTK